MELIFPFKNLAFNFLEPFFEEKIAKQYSKLRVDNQDIYESSLNDEIDIYRGRLPNFENEILQVIETTDQRTIDAYFESLKDNCKYILDLLEKENFIDRIEEWNKQATLVYDELVQRKTTEFLAHEDRNKYGHLEQFDGYEYTNSYLFGPLDSSAMKKIKITNYNFYCVEDLPELINTDYIEEFYEFVKSLANELLTIAKKYGRPWAKGEILSKSENSLSLKPILFCEGEHDISFIKKAAKLLEKEGVLAKFELRQRGGSDNLEKLWKILKENTWETVPQIKIFLFDCDVKYHDEDYGLIYKRVIPIFEKNIIRKGIENLFPDDLVNKAIVHRKEFVDIRLINGSKRGNDYVENQTVVNRDEKKSFCEWVCENGSKDDFNNFNWIFEMLENILNNSNH